MLDSLSPHLNQLVDSFADFGVLRLPFGVELLAEILEVRHEVQQNTDLITGPKSDYQKTFEIIWRTLSSISLGNIDWNGGRSASQLRAEFRAFKARKLQRDPMDLQSGFVAPLVDSQITITADALRFLLFHPVSSLPQRASRISKLRSQT